MNCETCQSIEQRLKAELGNRITRRLIDKILGIAPTTSKVCDICGQGYYAKGKCYKHYMAARRGISQILCNECDMVIINGSKGKDGKWYCSAHLAIQMPMDSTKLESLAINENDLDSGKDRGK